MTTQKSVPSPPDEGFDPHERLKDWREASKPLLQPVDLDKTVTKLTTLIGFLVFVLVAIPHIALAAGAPGADVITLTGSLQIFVGTAVLGISGAIGTIVFKTWISSLYNNR